MNTDIQHRQLEITIPVRPDLDLIYVQLQARRYAQRQGFSHLEAWEIATAVSELASLILSREDAGAISLRGLSDTGTGLEIETCLAHCDTATTAILRRYLDEISTLPRTEGGCVLQARRFLSPRHSQRSFA